MTTILLRILAAGFWFVLVGCSSNPEPEKAVIPQASPVKVRVATAARKETRRTVRLPGTVRSLTTAPLSSKVMGTVEEVRVRVGDRVKAGQLLAVVDSRDTEAMVAKSQAGLQEASMALQEVDKSLEAAVAQHVLSAATLKRYQALFDQKSVSPQEFEEVQTRERSAAASVGALQAKREQILARIQQGQADLRSAQALRSYTQLHSPLDGVVVQRQAEPGSLAVPGMPLLTVEATGRYRLEVPVEEELLASLRPRQSLAVELPSIGSATIRGTISEIQPAADPASRTYLVKMDLPAHPQLRSGMYGEVRLETGPATALWIQPQSLFRQGQVEGVYVLEEGNQVRLRLLRLGEAGDSGLEVLSGLSDGERYVIEGVAQLRDGAQVEVAP